jgi:hypothetical protein
VTDTIVAPPDPDPQQCQPAVSNEGHPGREVDNAPNEIGVTVIESYFDGAASGERLADVLNVGEPTRCEDRWLRRCRA